MNKWVLYNDVSGYYSESQPNYSWSFTNDLTKAKLWKTKRPALKQAKYGKELGEQEKRDGSGVINYSGNWFVKEVSVKIALV